MNWLLTLALLSLTGWASGEDGCSLLDRSGRAEVALQLSGAGALAEAYASCRPFTLRSDELIAGVKVRLESARPQAVALGAQEVGAWRAFRLARDGDRQQAVTCLQSPSREVELLFQEPWGVREASLELLPEGHAALERCDEAVQSEHPVHFLRPRASGWTLVQLRHGEAVDRAVIGSNLEAYRAWLEPNPDGSQIAVFDRQGDLGYSEPYRLQVFDMREPDAILATDLQNVVLGEASWTGPRHLSLEYSCGTRCVRRDRFLTSGLPVPPEEAAVTGALTGTVKMADEPEASATWRTTMTAHGNSAVWYNFDTLNMDLQRVRVRAAPAEGAFGELELVFNYVPEAFGDPVGSETFAFAQLAGANGERLVATDAELELTSVEVGPGGERTFQGQLRAAFAPRPWGGDSSGADAVLELDLRLHFSAEVAEPSPDGDTRW